MSRVTTEDNKKFRQELSRQADITQKQDAGPVQPTVNPLGKQ
jgi:hypothetical protein